MELKNLYKVMAEMPGGNMLTLPPESSKEMNAEIMEYVEDESIKVKFPLYEKYNNPAGIILGGFLPVFFDLSFGPLSYLAAKKPTASLDLNTTFIRPITIKDKEIIVKASVVNRSKSFLILEAQAFNSKNDLVAAATSRMMILN
ncbi:MAG: PaaI family thioesterase [Desulfobacteraceae bacterium]|nr:PaaI family thioesterase [Desulfobacteraceae bacterium]MCB9494078.1 PaaI family thioesterase [Desulfobacteraceae bacterium]